MFPSSQIYYINSTHRLSGSHGHFAYEIKCPSKCDFNRVCLLQANVPISYYLIPEGYNRFILAERKAGVDSTVVVTIPVGNYTAASFANLVPPLLNAASPNHWTYTMSFPSSFSSVQTGKFTFGVTGPTFPLEYPTFSFTQDMCEQFGFDEYSSNSFTGPTMLSRNIVSFVPETSILIHSDIVNDGDTDIFEVIFANNSVPLSNATYQCQDVAGYSRKLRTNQSSVYSFSLTDEHNKPLDLNGLSCIFTIIMFKQDILRVPLNNVTGGSVTIAATTSAQLEWKLPNSVYNLAQSYIGYQVDVPAQAAGVAGWIPEDCFEIATNAYFGTAGGLDLCNLNYVNRYTKVWRKAKTNFQDFISRDRSSQLYPSNQVAGNGNPTVANPIGVGTSTVNFLEPQYLQASTGGTLGREQAFTANRLFSLSGIPDTIFNIDKDVYYPIDMYIRLTAGVGNQFVFGSTTNADPTATPTAMTGNITIKNCYLYLAVEQNQLIVDSVMNKVLTNGLKLTIPYTTAWRNSTVGASAFSIQIPMTQQYGSKLKRMIHTVWNTTESGRTQLDCSNTNGSKVTLYNTFLDQQQLQDYQLSCVASTTTALNSLEGDWRENKKFCRNSCLLNRSVYQLNWFHCDQFYQPNATDKFDDSQFDDGIPMNTTRYYSFQGTAAGDLTHYNFATFVRHVMIDRNGVNFIN